MCAIARLILAIRARPICATWFATGGVDHKGIYDAYVNATSILGANILYKGNVYYKGTPYKGPVVCTSTGRLIALP